MAKVIPIYKNGDKHMVSNYRPVSLLSQFSKILEKLFVNRIDNFIDKYELLSDHQYGFKTQTVKYMDKASAGNVNLDIGQLN